MLEIDRLTSSNELVGCYKCHTITMSSLFVADCDDKECEQLCLNTGHGKGVCGCVEGYYLDTDGKSCIGKIIMLSQKI